MKPRLKLNSGRAIFLLQKLRLYYLSLFRRKRKDKIAFYVESPTILPHYQDIWKNTGSGEFDIIFGSHKENVLVKEFAESHQYAAYSCDDVIKKRIIYKTIIASFGFAELNLLGLNKIRMIYGLGKNSWMFSERNINVFDYHLVYGQFSEEMTRQKKSDAIVYRVGYPRLDSAFYLPKDNLRERLGVTSAKKVLVWLPTHTVSSIPSFIKVISQLQSEYEIIIKPHPNESLDNLSLIKKSGLRLINSSIFNNAELISFADYVLCDYGGSIFASVYLKKKILLLNSIEKPSLYKTFGDNSSTRGNSLEFEVRDNIPSVNPDVSGAIIKALLDDNEVWLKHTNYLNSLSSYLFEPYYGYSAKVAAVIIDKIHNEETQLIEDEINNIVERNKENGNLDYWPCRSW